MVVVFVNGTDRQQSWFIEAMDHCLYPWNRSTTTVRVEWVPEIVVNRDHHSFAVTTWDPDNNLDSCGRPNLAYIQIREDLDDPHRPGNDVGWPLGTYSGKEFYMESVIHELGHVVQEKFNQAQKDTLTLDCYDGKQASDWDDPKLRWWHQRQESDAETFKDVWLPKPYRKFNNRTSHRLQLANFDKYLGVLDQICPCEDTTDCVEAQLLFREVNGGAPGFTPEWFEPKEPTTDMSALGPSHPSNNSFTPFMLQYKTIKVRFRWGGSGYEVGYQEVENPNPYWSPTNAPLTNYYIEVYDLPSGGTGWRLVGAYNLDPMTPNRWWWNPREPSLVPHQFGAWVAIGAEAPSEDVMTGSGFVPTWFVASLKLCGAVIIN